MSTIKDVAKRAGVAISTVSAVINRSAPVSPETIARVERAIAEIGYLPHGAAQSLRSGQSRMIGLIVPSITNPHFSATARVIENVCLSAGYMSMVYSTGQDPERENQILKIMRQQRVAGLIIIPTKSDAAHGDRLRTAIHVPAVLLDMYVEGLPYDVVKLDNVRATRLATEHLIGLGHRRIAVTTGIKGLATSEDRLAGYLEAHAAHGIPVDKKLLLRGDFDQDIAYASVIEVMKGKAPPTAILSITNMMTLGVMLALRKLEQRVPDDVSFVGIDDFDFAEIMNPPPTVIRVPVAAMAERAVTILLEEIASKRKPVGVRQLFTPELIVRESARAPRHAEMRAPVS